MAGSLRIDGPMVVDTPDAKAAADTICSDHLVDAGALRQLRAELWRVGVALACQRFYMPPEEDQGAEPLRREPAAVAILSGRSRLLPCSVV